MRHSLFALLTLTLALTACKVPEEVAKQPTEPKQPVAREQVNAIEERKKMEAMKDKDMDEMEMDDKKEMDEMQDHKDEMVMMDKEEGEESMDDHGGWVDEAGNPGQYTGYVDGVVGNGMESVLFFHATWCPACKKNNGLLTSWYSSEEFSRSVYKIDFDTATDLRREFGVNGQDTFILIDGNGNEIQRVSFPSESALRALLG